MKDVAAILVALAFAAVMTALVYAGDVVTDTKHGRVIVSGELQRHYKKDATFWVNGLRFEFEDRPEARDWMNLQVGKQVEIVIRTQ